MRHRMLGLLIASLFAAGAQHAQAHPGHGEDSPQAPCLCETEMSRRRRWSTDDPAVFEDGSFVTARAGKVQIRRSDDSLADLPMHRLRAEDREFVEERQQQIREAINGPVLLARADPPQRAGAETTAPIVIKHYAPFVKLNAIRTRWDDRYFYVESNGMPAHRMMVGITAWQQQVPIPQTYSGGNAWQIPLTPVPAQIPAVAKNRFLRGAIAVAVNGIPIFNPLNNRGDDAYLFGELDEFGGHCGRADDYHYHIAPVHLEEIVGKGQPIAYALDGYPIYGYQDSNAPDFAPLDSLNGHQDAHGNYHYHATRNYPYLNGGFHGEVVERDGQVDPQPRAQPLRPSLPPMRDAKITDFKETNPGSYLLTYDVRGKIGAVRYTLGADGSASFVFTDTNGKTTNETYSAKRHGPDGKDRQPPPRNDNKPPRRDENRPPRDSGRPPRNEDRPATIATRESSSRPKSDRLQLAVTSSSVDGNGFISVDCTCDGARQSPAVEWKNAPKGTMSFALTLWHAAPDQEKSYWLIYNIPANVTKLEQNARPVGTLGLNDRRRAEYDPMCSKGPGVKNYHITVFALADEPRLSPEKSHRAALLEAIKEITLAEGTLDFQYERKR